MTEVKKLSRSEYPANLEILGDFLPEELFISGEVLPEDSLAIAIAGTRTPTSAGQSMAYKLAFDFAGAGVTVVSGLARGVDSVAHSAALDAGGRTIAVLGSGIDVIYPPENEDLYEKISQSGAVISAFSLGQKPLPENFLARNRIVAALSLAVIVVEGRSRSGTLSTARHAADLGREVFAVAGDVHSPLSAAPNYLIKEGVTPITNAWQVLDYLKTMFI